MMEVENMSSVVTSASTNNKDEDDDVPLPGFRFHPTDEELVGFYLRRKVEKRPISIELIKQIDIYKHDPWDLPKASNVGDKEWYFFCKRGRKYRNSIRPNRVTGSGFWKATGIDRPIYSAGGEGRDCIGLKKSLVYYRGSAGKGSKTDWMMHEFRLPADHDKSADKHIDPKAVPQEAAEVWTLCRIFKRNVAYRKCVPDWREVSANKRNPNLEATSKTCSLESSTNNNTRSQIPQGYISFTAPLMNKAPNYHVDKNVITYGGDRVRIESQGLLISSQLMSSVSQPQYSTSSTYSSFMASDHVNEFYKHGDWDELRSIVECSAADPFY